MLLLNWFAKKLRAVECDVNGNRDQKNYNVFLMKSWPYIRLFVSLTLLATATLAQGRSSKRATVWSWSGECPNSMMAVQIVIKGRTIYRSSFRACKKQLRGANTERGQGTLIFRFSARHTFQATYRTAKSEEIEGNIWQAGADSDAILLGVSFVTHRQVLLNTIHVVKPCRPTQSILDRDLLIRTYPLKPIAH